MCVYWGGGGLVLEWFMVGRGMVDGGVGCWVRGMTCSVCVCVCVSVCLCVCVCLLNSIYLERLPHRLERPLLHTLDRRRLAVAFVGFFFCVHDRTEQSGEHLVWRTPSEAAAPPHPKTITTNGSSIDPPHHHCEPHGKQAVKRLNQPTNQPTKQAIDHVTKPTNQPTNQPINH